MSASLEPSPKDVEDLRKAYLEDLESRGESTIHPNDLNRVKTDDHYLTRFLLHHDNNQKLALEMMKGALEWRKTFNVNEINAKTVKIEYMVEGGFFSRGRDKDGCAILIFKCSKHIKNDPKKDMNEVKRCVIYWFEKLEKEEKGKPITIFFDMEGCGLSNMDLDFTKYLIGLFKEYYPYFLNYIIIFEMAWILNAAFKIIKTWLPEKAVQKIKMLKKADVFNYVPQEQALKCWGGSDDYVYSFLPDASEEAMTFAPGNKKVHFEENGVPLSETSTMSDRDSESPALRVSPESTITFSKDGAELISTVELKNVSNAAILSYKMKTTAPEKFRVRPSAGVLQPGATATIVVTLLPGYQVGGLAKDKFLVMSFPIESDRLTASEISDLWKNTSGRSVSQHRLRCAQSSPLPTRNGNALSMQMGAEEGVDLVKISSSVERLRESQETLGKTLQRTLTLQYVNTAVLVVIAIGLINFLLKMSGDNSASTSYHPANAEL